MTKSGGTKAIAASCSAAMFLSLAACGAEEAPIETVGITTTAMVTAEATTVEVAEITTITESVVRETTTQEAITSGEATTSFEDLISVESGSGYLNADFETYDMLRQATSLTYSRDIYYARRAEDCLCSYSMENGTETVVLRIKNISDVYFVLGEYIYFCTGQANLMRCDKWGNNLTTIIGDGSAYDVYPRVFFILTDQNEIYGLTSYIETESILDERGRVQSEKTVYYDLIQVDPDTCECRVVTKLDKNCFYGLRGGYNNKIYMTKKEEGSQRDKLIEFDLRNKTEKTIFDPFTEEEPDRLDYNCSMGLYNDEPIFIYVESVPREKTEEEEIKYSSEWTPYASTVYMLDVEGNKKKIFSSDNAISYSDIFIVNNRIYVAVHESSLSRGEIFDITENEIEYIGSCSNSSHGDDIVFENPYTGTLWIFSRWNFYLEEINKISS